MQKTITQTKASQPVSPQGLSVAEKNKFQQSLLNNGKTTRGWARENQLDPNAVQCLLSGITKGRTGLAFQAKKTILSYLETLT